MIQTAIKKRLDQSEPFSFEEVDGNWNEIIARTHHNVSGYNSIQELGTKLLLLITMQPSILDSIVYDLGNIGSGPIHTFVNGLDVSTFDDAFGNGWEDLENGDNAYLFFVIMDGIRQTYRFNADSLPKVIGLGNSPTVATDFDLIASSGDENLLDNPYEVIITEKSQIVNQDLDITKTYKLVNNITLLASDRIRTNNLKLLYGSGHDIVTITTTEPNSLIFQGDACTDVRISDLSISAGGSNSKAFDVEDINGTHEVRLKGVNFNGTNKIGDFRGFRQGFWTDLGFYGCSDGATFHGTWTGFKLFSSNLFGFGLSGTLLKKGIGLTFSNRFYIDLNASLITGSKITDFDASIFLANELFQINACQIVYNGVVDEIGQFTNLLIPNISANSKKSLWSNNIGLPNTAIERYIEENIAETYTVNWLNSVFNLTMTDDTVFNEINLPANLLKSKEIKMYLTGQFVPTFIPAWLTNLVGTYKGDEINEISLRCLKNGVYYMKIANSLTEYPAPDLNSISPLSVLPNTTSEVILNGSFFTPATIVSIEGQTVNSVEFINSGQLKLSVTSGIIEDYFDVTISNGTTVTFIDVFVVNIGEVFLPTFSDWTNLSPIPPDLTTDGQVILSDYSLAQTGRWNKPINYTKDWIVRFNMNPSALGTYIEDRPVFIELVNSAGTKVVGIALQINPGSGSQKQRYFSESTGYALGTHAMPSTAFTSTYDKIIQAKTYKPELRFINGVLFFYANNLLQRTFENVLTENLFVKISLKEHDVIDIKYIELP